VREVQLTPSDQGFVGKASVSIEVSDPDGKLVDGAKVTVTNKSNEEVLVSDYTKSGSVLALLQAGIP